MITDGCNAPTTDRFNVRVKRAEFSMKAEQDFCFPTFAELQEKHYKITDIDLLKLHENFLKLEQCDNLNSLNITSNFLDFSIDASVKYESFFLKYYSFILCLDNVKIWTQEFKKNGKCIINDGNGEEENLVPYVMYLQNYIENKLIERDSTIVEESATSKLWRNIKKLECEK